MRVGGQSLVLLQAIVQNLVALGRIVSARILELLQKFGIWPGSITLCGRTFDYWNS